MEWLNYHHLLYFWVVAREGTITGASRELRLAHPTISGQIHRLDIAQSGSRKQSAGEVLVDRSIDCHIIETKR